MHWFLRLVLVTFVVGLVATLATSLACGLWSGSRAAPPSPPPWPMPVPAQWPAFPDEVFRTEGVGFARTVARTKSRGRVVRRQIMVECGWPWPAVYHCLTVTDAMNTTAPMTAGRFEHPMYSSPISIAVPSWALGPNTSPVYLPCEPLWAGLLADSAVFAAAAAFLVPAWRGLRCVWRPRTAQCPFCRHPLSPDGRCTECGAVLRGPANERCG